MAGEKRKFENFIMAHLEDLCMQTDVNEKFINCCIQKRVFTDQDKREILSKGIYSNKASYFYDKLKQKGPEAPALLYQVATALKLDGLLHLLRAWDFHKKFPGLNQHVPKSSTAGPSPSPLAGATRRAGLRDDRSTSGTPKMDSPTNHPQMETRLVLRLLRQGGPPAGRKESGLALIINVINSIVPEDIRRGAILDTTALMGAFRRFEIPTYFVENQEAMLSHQDITNLIREFKSEFVAGQHKFSFVAVMGHGGKGKDKMKDSKAQDFEITSTIFKPFYGDQFPVLQDHAKIFIMQCCRGEKLVSTVPVVTDGPTAWRPAISDVLTLWSTIDGYGAFRYPGSGTQFIQSFSDALHGHADSLIRDPNLRKEFRDVVRKVQEDSRHWVIELKSSGNMSAQPPVKKRVSQPMEIVDHLFRSFYLLLEGKSEYGP